MIITNLLYILVLIIIGKFISRSSRFPDNTADVLNTFVLNIALPAIIIISISKVELSSNIVYPVAIHWVAFIINIILILLFKKIFKFSKSVFSALLIVSTLGNTAFLGIPMTKSMLGDSSIPFAVLYDQLGSAIAFNIYGAIVLPMILGNSSNSVISIIKKLITFPPFIALVIGLVMAVFKIELTYVVDVTLRNIAAALIPCAMIAVGFQMKMKLPKETLKYTTIGLGIKLVLLPMIILVICKGFGLKGLSVDTSIIQSGMPPMITAGAMATSAKLESELSVALVAYGLLAAFITLPIIHYFL
ncbi:MAG: AEC family transporter [Bacteriovoracaceae bacterium]|nr:AEC family transporter [Bacteriovoracaceae bacterium]